MKIEPSDKTVRQCTTRTLRPRLSLGIVIVVLLPATVFGQTSFTWQQIKEKFEAANPTLKAAQLNIDESRAAEITAYLRPNPDFALSIGWNSDRPL